MTKTMFHSPLLDNKELDADDMYIGQKVQIIGYYTRYDDSRDEDRENSSIFDGDRCLYKNMKGYLDSYHLDEPEIIVLKDEALLLKNFKVKAIG